jgi:hypothetical protein
MSETPIGDSCVDDDDPHDCSVRLRILAQR